MDTLNTSGQLTKAMIETLETHPAFEGKENTMCYIFMQSDDDGMTETYGWESEFQASFVVLQDIRFRLQDEGINVDKLTEYLDELDKIMESRG